MTPEASDQLHVLVVGMLKKQEHDLVRRLPNVRLRFIETDDFNRAVPSHLDAVVLNAKFMSHTKIAYVKRSVPDHVQVVTVHGGLTVIALAIIELEIKNAS